MANETVNLGWLKDYNDTKFAPKTTLSSVLSAGGSTNSLVMTGASDKNSLTTIASNSTTTQKFLSQTNSGTPTWETPPDHYVSQSETVSSSWRKVLLSYQLDSQANDPIVALTNVTYTNTNLAYQPSTGTLKASVVYGAVWNDYAEYRKSDIIEPGRCITEKGDDTLILTTERLQRGCEIVSDTFGFAIGETDECKTPVATSGRVLAYLYEGREAAAAHIGWPVCSGPDGTVSIMTPEEEEKYPSRIIGTISAVPDYEIWGTGNVKVNGRIWIRIR